MTMSHRTTRLAVVCIVALAARLTAQTDQESERVALAYHKVAGVTFDARAIAERSDAVRRASSFDRPDAMQNATTALESRLASATVEDFPLRVDDAISEYDHDRNEFSIALFQPGYYVPLWAFGQEYRVVFANASSARAIPMPKDEARAFDERLRPVGRRVTNELRFKVIGTGDPAGGVTGDRVIRAELVAVRLLDARTGALLYEPTLQPVAVAAAAAAAAEASFNLADADVAGFRVGVKGKDLEATLARMFGPVSRGKAMNTAPSYLPSTLDVNSLRCMSIPGRDRPKAGTVCVSAQLDADDIVRVLTVERLFPWFDGEVFRSALTRKYGPVSLAARSVGYALAWGPSVDASTLGSSSGPVHALTANYASEDDFLSRSGNALPPIRLSLRLIDVKWVAKQAR